jgi:hypothetical protein
MKIVMPFVLVSVLLTGCSHGNAPVQKELTGTWTNELGMTVVSQDGSCHSQMTTSDGKTINQVGSMIVKNGELIVTLTSTTETNVRVPIQVIWPSFRFANNGRELQLIGNNGVVQAELYKIDK